MKNARERVRFLLGSQPTEIEFTDPNLTLLDYLRTSARLTGTKEGCSEGDCGACTVLIGEFVNENLRYRSVNACIVLLAMVDNKQILTVEHIAKSDMSPTQHAIANQHGSQCGFCTPGFVMSLTGLQWLAASSKIKSSVVDREQVNEHLAGNLCRCTGYGPIISAALTSCSAPLPESWQTQAITAKTILRKWENQDQPLCCINGNSMFAAPRSRAALEKLLLDYPNATMVAGATDISIWITKLGVRLSTIIYLGHVSDLQRIDISDTKVEIGAAVSLQDARSALRDIASDFDRLVRRFGSRQVRSQATVCGNIANGSPIGDLSPAFIALGAKLRISGELGLREIPLEEFFVDYGKQDITRGEYIKSVVIAINHDFQFRCWKVSKRFDQDISAVLGAFSAKIENGYIHQARICFGGMAATPKRARQCEAILAGKPLNNETLSQAREALTCDFSPITDIRASAHYRQRVAGNLLEKFFLAMSATELPDIYEPLKPRIP
jgi:xanthine dehydrogenase small subunit